MSEARQSVRTFDLFLPALFSRFKFPIKHLHQPEDQMGKNVSCVLFSLIMMIVVANPAYATTFECTTEKAFEWKDGALQPSTFFQQTRLSFDDQASTLWMAHGDNSSTPVRGKIELPLGPKNDLIFVAHITAKNPAGSTIFHMRGWSLDSKTLHFSTVRLSFIVYEDSPPIILTGGCERSGGSE